MPGKLRKSRSRNNNNRPASKQSRKRKTPKGKGKARKTTRRRVKRGGVDEAASGCDVFTKEFIEDETNGILFNPDPRGVGFLRVLNLEQFRTELRKKGCEDTDTVKENLRQVLKGILEDTDTVKNSRNCVEIDNILDDIISILGEPTQEVIDENKNFYNEDMFYSIKSTLRPVELTLSTDDKKSLAKAKEEGEKPFIREGLTLLFRDGSDTRQMLIKELSRRLFKPVSYNKDLNFVFDQYKENRTYKPKMEATKKAYENAVRRLNLKLAKITNFWFLDFCSLDRNAKTTMFYPNYYSSDFYAEKILNLYLTENGITKGE